MAPFGSTRVARGALVVAVVLVVVGIVATQIVNRANDDPIAEAIEIVNDEELFARGVDTGVAFVRISRVLKEGAESCEEEQGVSVECDALFSGAAYAQVLAVSVLDCTKPGMFEARENMRTYLKSLRESPSTQVPNLTRCVK